MLKIRSSFFIGLIGVFLCTFFLLTTYGGNQDTKEVKNVIFMIPDGYSAAYATNYRWFKGSEPLMDRMLVGMVKTYSASSEVTDSAAAGTAMATGVKTKNGMISISPKGKKLQTILEAASDTGKSSGLVVTSTVTHATPAVFASHVTSRKKEAEIAKQYIGKVDVILGGGKKYFLPKSQGGVLQNEDLIATALRQGYQLVESKEELHTAKKNKLLGLFAEEMMASELDRQKTSQPSLADMTKKAIETLDRNKKGFFLMVEGSQIDQAIHNHDAAWAMADTAAFEKAVEVALDFAKKNGKTLIVIAGDHDTGGMSVGGYEQYQANVDLLRQVKATGEEMARQLRPDRTNIRATVKNATQLDLTDTEVQKIRNANNPTRAINDVISKRALIGWTSSVHTGTDVPLYAYGPASELFAGLKDNTDLPKLMAKAMGIKLNN